MTTPTYANTWMENIVIEWLPLEKQMLLLSRKIPPDHFLLLIHSVWPYKNYFLKCFLELQTFFFLKFVATQCVISSHMTCLGIASAWQTYEDRHLFHLSMCFILACLLKICKNQSKNTGRFHGDYVLDIGSVSELAPRVPSLPLDYLCPYFYSS